jgi:hypothetical protein
MAQSVQMHRRAVLSFCNLGILDYETGLMYKQISSRTASKPGTDHRAGFCFDASEAVGVMAVATQRDFWRDWQLGAHAMATCLIFSCSTCG